MPGDQPGGGMGILRFDSYIMPHGICGMSLELD